jgi:hypothetical protein
MDEHDVMVTVTDVDDETVTPMPGGTLLERYDDDDDDEISKMEYLAAADDFFDRVINKPTLLEVADLYFDSQSN